MLTANEYQTMCNRTVGSLSKDELMINAALGLCGESGEVADHLKKHLYQGHELDKENLIKELGDISWYVSAMATALGVTLEDVFKKNNEKLNKRYPSGFSKEASINRVE